jgi:hypothetical protein
VQPGLRGSRAGGELGGEFGVAEPLPLKGQHRLALAQRQVSDRPPDALRQLRWLGQLVGASGRVGPIAREGQGDKIAAQPLADEVQRDPRVPRPELLG